MKIYFDIETVPTRRAEVIDRIIKNISPPGNLKKAETIEQWEIEKKPDLIDEAIRKTALNGTFGEIISIAWAVDSDPVQGMIRKLEDSEAELLQRFMYAMANALENEKRIPVWIGHYITGFDLRFIWQRCVVNKIKPIAAFPHDEKPWSSRIYDTKLQWTGLQSYSGDGSLDALCLAFGLPGKGDMDGSQVWDYIQAGRYREVLEYNQGDVEQVRAVHRMMTFSSVSP